MILAVDPGIRGCGCATFDDGILTRAWYVVNPIAKGDDVETCLTMAGAVWRTTTGSAIPGVFTHVAIEWPRVYTRDKSKGDPNDLLPLVAVGATVVVLLKATGVRYYPHEWKGQLTKDACHARVRARLSVAERETIEMPRAVGLGHNVLDAVGIGLHHVGRLKRERVLPGAT